MKKQAQKENDPIVEELFSIVGAFDAVAMRNDSPSEEKFIERMALLGEASGEVTSVISMFMSTDEFEKQGAAARAQNLAIKFNSLGVAFAAQTDKEFFGPIAAVFKAQSNKMSEVYKRLGN